MVQALLKNGPSAYGLVGVLATMDDLSRDAEHASVLLLYPTRSQQPKVGVLASVIALTNSGAGCNDIAELIMHATLRFIDAEESLIGSIAGQK
jgi:hypothetical protein